VIPSWSYFFLAAPIVILGVALVVRHFAKMYGPERLRRWFVAARESGRLFVVMAIAVPAGYMLMIALFMMPFGGSVLIRLLDNLPMACMFAGLQFMSLSRRPTGEQIRCSKCKYSLEGLEAGMNTGPGGRHDARCPECGGQWGWPGGSVKVNKRWAPGWIALSVILLLPLVFQFGSATFGKFGIWENSVLRIVPTSCLVEEVLTKKGFKTAAWVELNKRTISQGNRRRLAEGLFERPAGTYWSTEEQAWTTRELLLKRIDAELVRRRLLQYVEDVRVGSDPKTGEPRLEVSNPATNQFEPFGGVEVRILIATREVDGSGPQMVFPPGSYQGKGTMYVPIDEYTGYHGRIRFALLSNDANWPEYGANGKPIFDLPGVLYSASKDIDLHGPRK
jgi:hypothetical protein